MALTILKESEYVAIDTETNAQDVRDGRGFARGLSLASGLYGFEYMGYFPFRHSQGGNLDHRDASILSSAISSYQGTAVFHNAKFDLTSLETLAVDYRGPFYDTMLMAHLVDENMFSKDLTSVAKRWADGESKKDSPEYKKMMNMFSWDVPVELIREYAEWDALITYRAFNGMFADFEKEVPEKYWEHKQDFVRTMIAIEKAGVRIDPDKCRRMITIGENVMGDIVENLGGLNPGSNTDLKELLIDKLGLPVVKSSPKTGKPSFDKYAMEAYEEILEAKDDPTAQEILAFRGWQKTVSSNYKAYLNFVSPDGRVRPNFKLHGTKTGRLSCYEPNLQQIPKETSKEWNGDLKTTFIPENGFSIWEADYSQLELRLAAAYAREEELLKIFEEDRDVFTEMSQSLGMTRNDTKTLVYSIQYGGGVNRLVNVFGVTPKRAADLRENFFNTYTGFRRVSNLASNHCLTNGRVQLWTGRFRHFKWRKDEAHKAFNSVMQGGAADIMEQVMVRLYKELVDENCRMILQVHDAVWFEIKQGMEEEYHDKIRAIMTDLPAFGVTFAVDIHKIGA